MDLPFILQKLEPPSVRGQKNTLEIFKNGEGQPHDQTQVHTEPVVPGFKGSVQIQAYNLQIGETVSHLLFFYL